MSVYIKAFPLPNNCGACPLRLAWCRERIYMVTRPERCPLVPVPTHGRLIDADALIEWLYSDEPNALKAPFRLCTADRSDVIFLLKNAPTIIPADPKEEGE